MLDFGWPELFLIAVIAVFVIGPNDIPKLMHAAGRFFRRLQYVRYAISQQFDEVLKTGDIDELRKGVNFEDRDVDQNGEIKEQPRMNTNGH